MQLQLKDIFYVYINQPPAKWPKGKRICIKVLGEICPMNSEEKMGTYATITAHPGKTYILTPMKNPYGFKEGWLMFEDGIHGAAANWWMEQLEAGLIEVTSVLE